MNKIEKLQCKNILEFDIEPESETDMEQMFEESAV